MGKPHSQRVRVVNISSTSQRLHILGPATDCFKVRRGCFDVLILIDDRKDGRTAQRTPFRKKNSPLLALLCVRAVLAGACGKGVMFRRELTPVVVMRVGAI